MATTADPPRRRGRPRAGEREERHRRVIDAAFAELVEHGAERVTMLGIAERAGASKETLYSWFGNRLGLLRAMIEENADGAAARVRAALEGDADPRETLVGFAAGLLTLLTDPRSVALNRAAMTSPELAETLLASGRHRVGPIVEEYLVRLDADGVLSIDDPAAAFRLLYGLVIQDTQIRVLLGEAPPGPVELRAQAERGVAAFFRLSS
ncbi:MAG: TetR/AcrR family transcriptional regulator [Actinomycetota bacterium]